MKLLNKRLESERGKGICWFLIGKQVIWKMGMVTLVPFEKLMAVELELYHFECFGALGGFCVRKRLGV